MQKIDLIDFIPDVLHTTFNTEKGKVDAALLLLPNDLGVDWTENDYLQIQVTEDTIKISTPRIEAFFGCSQIVNDVCHRNGVRIGVMISEGPNRGAYMSDSR